MNEEYSENSDSSDEDYVPTSEGNGEVLSEVDSDGDPEETLEIGTEDAKPSKPSKRRTKSKTKQVNNNHSTTNSQTNPELTAEEKKKRADDIWASFKKDTQMKTKSSTSQQSAIPKDTVKVTKVFQFAGEEVKVEKEVSADSEDARFAESPSVSSSSEAVEATKPSFPCPKRKSGGVASILNQLGKKQKLSTLEKTQLDWNRFKHDEKIEDELEAYKKGKDGYLERQDFLQRADLRTFEIEKEVRGICRSKRIN